MFTEREQILILGLISNKICEFEKCLYDYEATEEQKEYCLYRIEEYKKIMKKFKKLLDK